MLKASFNYIAGSTSPPITSGLIGWYEADSLSGTQWKDKSGANNHATVGGPAPTVVSYALNARGYLTGGASSSITFPVALPSTYTILHVTRYSPTSSIAGRQRIVGQPNNGCNWLSGHWGYSGPTSGVAFHNADLASFVDRHGTDWVLSTDQWTMYRSNGVDRTDRTPVAFCQGGAWGVNQVYMATVPEVTDGWQMGLMLVYTRLLTATEIQTMETWIITRFGLGEH